MHVEGNKVLFEPSNWNNFTEKTTLRAQTSSVSSTASPHRCVNTNASCHWCETTGCCFWKAHEISWSSSGGRLSKIGGIVTTNPHHKIHHAAFARYCEKICFSLSIMISSSPTRVYWKKCLSVRWFLWMSEFLETENSFWIISFIIELSSWARKTTSTITLYKIKSSQILL